MDIKVGKKLIPLAADIINLNCTRTINLKRVLIADLGDWAGHRPNYLKTIIRLFEHEDRTCYVITSNKEAVEQFLKTKNILNIVVLTLKFSVTEKIILKGVHRFDQLIHFFKLDTWFQPQSVLQLLQIKFLQRRHKLSEVLVFFTSASDLMPLVPIWARYFLFPKKWSGIYVTPWYNTGTIFSKKAKRSRAYGDRSMSISSCQGIFVIHPSYTRYYRQLLGKDHFFNIPEPISLEINEQFELATKIKKRAKGRFIITLLGGIGKKRNLLLLLDALNLLKNNNWFLVIIGKLQESDFSASEINLSDTFFKRYDTQCFIKLDGYVTVEQDFNALINATDLMYLHYHNHPFSSNQLLKAIAFRKPVIVNRGGIVEAIVQQAKWSAIVPYDSEVVAMEIKKFQNKFTIDEAAYADFMQSLDYKNLRTTILNQLEKTNLPASGN